MRNWESVEEYNSRVYHKIRTQIPIELAKKFDEKCKSEGVSKASIIKKYMEQFVNED